MLIGYARVSTVDQRLDLQREALEEAGCERIFQNTAGGVAERPALREALAQLRADPLWCGDSTGWAARSRTSSRTRSPCVRRASACAA